VVTRTTCTHDQGVEEFVSRQTAVRRDDNGLTEVVSESDGKEDGRFFVTDGGRVAHAVLTGEAKELLGDDFVGRLGILGEQVNAPLEQNRPVSLRIPVGRLFGPGATTKLPGADKLRIDGTLEYLGQTLFNGVRAAGYRVRIGAVLPVQGIPLSIEANGLSYSEVASGLQLHSRMQMLVTVSDPKQGKQTFTGLCLSTLDRSASSGL
jgi:hypothetical protein